MFENKTEAQAREEILALVAEYAETFHNQKKEFKEGDRIPYASRVYDKDEMVNLVDSSLEFWLTSGRYTDEFEKKLADYLGVRFCSLVNSGSRINIHPFLISASCFSFIINKLEQQIKIVYINAFCSFYYNIKNFIIPPPMHNNIGGGYDNL